MNTELIIREIQSLQFEIPLNINSINLWLDKHYPVYNSIVDILPCSNRSLPCICCNKDYNCLFKEVYLELDKYYHLQKKDSYYQSEIVKYNSIKHDLNLVKLWFKKHLDFESNYLDNYCEKNEHPDIMLKFYYGNERNRVFNLNINGKEFKNIYDFYWLHNKLFFEDVIFPKEYNIWKKDFEAHIIKPSTN